VVICVTSRPSAPRFGVVEVGFRRIQRGLIAFDLRVNGANLRLFDRQLRRGGIQILLRDRLVLASAC
jgi:hypothetical protein